MGRGSLLALVFVVACGSDPGASRDGGTGAEPDAAAGFDGGSAPDAAAGRDGGSAPDAGSHGGADLGTVDVCADRPPLDLPIAFDVIYGNASPTPMRFEGVTEWIDALGMPFPRDTGSAKRLRTRRGEYLVLAFDTSDVDAVSGLFDTDNPQITTHTGSKLMAISRCPGDFRPSEDPDCVRSTGVASGLRWGFEDAPFRCRLERDQRYYLNILFTGDEALPAEWACTLAPDADDCAVLFATRSE